MEKHRGQTTTDALVMKEQPSTGVQWQEPFKRSRAEELTKNLAVAAALLICVTALRSGALPGSEDMMQTVLTAATGDTLLDDQLGRLTFVSTLFPEATLVFGEGHADMSLISPVEDGEIVHAWSESEPYTTWNAPERMVYSAIGGEVMGVYHGEDEQMIVHVQGEDGLSCLSGDLASVIVSVGDRVEPGTLLGYLPQDTACFLEVRQNGWSIDPTPLLNP